MNAAIILEAIHRLNAAATAFRVGKLTIDEWMRLADDCSETSFKIKAELQKECPDINIERINALPWPNPDKQYGDWLHTKDGIVRVRKSEKEKTA
jgi:hypothetical protein